MYVNIKSGAPGSSPLTRLNLQSSVLPVLSGWVLVLLKLLLATVTASPGPNQQQDRGYPGQTSRKDELVIPFGSAGLMTVISLALAPSRPRTPSLDDIDVTRHREITSKAVSAILLLTLKWFKVSRALIA